MFSYENFGFLSAHGAERLFYFSSDPVIPILTPGRFA